MRLSAHDHKKKHVFKTRVKCRNEGHSACNPSFWLLIMMVEKLFEVKLLRILYYHACIRLFDIKFRVIR
jgi:hypothetical protein